MKPSRIRSKKPTVIGNSRWLAHATAGAASAFTSASAEAAIHYSGRIGQFFGSCNDKSARFQLDQPGDSIRLRHTLELGCTPSYGGSAYFGILGRAGNAFAGFYCPTNPQVKSVSRLNRGELISRRPFLTRESGVLAAVGTYYRGQFDSGDLGFIGFRFNNGSGDQYGWVRIKMGTHFPIDNDFWLLLTMLTWSSSPTRCKRLPRKS
jgi:hypothetical protein